MLNALTIKAFIQKQLLYQLLAPLGTRRFANYIKELCRFRTITEVAYHLEIDWKTVKAIDKEALLEEHYKTDYTGLRILAIDEIAYAKHHK